MNEIQIMNSKEPTMTSLELVDLINKFRKEEFDAGGKCYREKLHKTIMRDIRSELEAMDALGIKDDQYNFVLTSFTDCQNRIQSCYQLTRDGALQILNKESTYVRVATIRYINSLEERVNHVPQLSAEDMAIVKIIHQVKAGNVPSAVCEVLTYGQEKYDEGYEHGATDKMEEMQPALDYMEVMEKAGGKMLVREAAKIIYTKDRIEIGERKLHAVLRHWKWEVVGRGNTEPSQYAIKSRFLIAKPVTRYSRKDERYYVTYTPYVTAKGLTHITKKLLQMSIEDINAIYREDKKKMNERKQKA